MAMIADEPDLLVCGEASDSQGALAAIARRMPDLAIIDVALGGGVDGLDLVRALKVRYPMIPALVLSVHPDSLYGERALRAGAQGYLNKQQLGDAVLIAMRRVLAGGIYVSESLGMTLATHFVRGSGRTTSPLGALSDRELQVFRLIGDGRRTRDIAAILHLSPKTIETYREHIKQKLGLDTASDLLRRAVRFVDAGE
jgi:DNA-binding NarL/FixJ family response regulator